MRWSRSGYVGGLLFTLAMNVALGGQSSPDSPEGGEIFSECPDCPEMVVIPAGSFRMGADGEPVRNIEVAAFAMGRLEVTREQYGAFVEQTGYAAGDGCRVWQGYPPDRNSWTFVWDEQLSWRDPGFEQGRDHPVVCVSWADAAAYATWLSGVTKRQYRLPSGVEWEYATRAGTTTLRHWGDEWQCGYANVLDRSWQTELPDEPVVACDDRAKYTRAAGISEPNGFGIHDTIGNVFEHVADCQHDPVIRYRVPSDAAPWLQGDCRHRMHLGGGWDSPSPTSVNPFRNYRRVGDRVSTLGFRVAMTIE